MANTEKTIQDVVENNYCTGCGACAFTSNTKMSINKYGEYVPSELLSQPDKISALESKVCPSLSPELNENKLGEVFLDGKNQFSTKIGFFDAVYGGYVKEGGFRDNGTSGGMGSWIGYELLQKGLIDGVIHAKPVEYNKQGDPFFKYGVSYTAEEISQGAKTKYHVVELSEVLSLIKNSPNGKYLFIGVPCLIKSLRRIQLVDSLIKERVKYTMSLVCGHFKSVNWTHSLVMSEGIDPKDITSFQYRTKGNGIEARKYFFKAEIENKGSSKTVLKDSAKVVGGKFNQGAMMLPACEFCDDVVGETADITIGDAWLPIFEADSQGTNLLIVRNKKINEILKLAKSEDRVKLTELSEKDAVDSQSGGFRQRNEGLSYRLEKLQKKNIWIPQKRIKPGAFQLSYIRKKVYDKRSEVTKTSRQDFVKVLETNDYKSFELKYKGKLHRLRRLEQFSTFYKSSLNLLQRKFFKLIKK